MTKTKWYPGNIKPVHRGIYEIRGYWCDVRVLKWSGARWRWLSGGVSSFGAMKSDQWRGLTEPRE